MPEWLIYFLQNPAHSMTLIALGGLFGILILLYLKRGVFVSLFKKVDSLVIVLLVFLILFGFCTRLYFDNFLPSDEEWEELLFAKKLFNGEGGVFNDNRYGLGYPLLLSFGFTFFGLEISVAWWLNVVLVVLSGLLVFIIAKLIFDSNPIALFSTAVYFLTPSILHFMGVKMGHPGIVSFLLLLFTFAAILAFRRHEYSFYILSILTIAFAAQTKPEFLFLIVPFGVLFFLFREYRFLDWKKMGVLLLLTIILLFPVFIKSQQAKISYQNSDWCGHPSQTFHSGKQWSYSLPVATQLDPILKSVLNDRFSFNYFIYDLPTFFNYWFSGAYLLIVPFVLLGLFWGLWKEKYRRPTLLVLFTFFSLSFIYLADCAFYEARFAVALYPLLVVYSGFGVYFVSSKLSKIKFGNYFSSLLPLLVLLVLVFIFQSEFKGWRRKYNTRPRFSSQHTLRHAVERVPRDNSFVFTVHRNEKMLLEFWGYDALNITNFLNQQSSQVFDEKGAISSFQIPLREEKDNYYIESWYCDLLPKVEQVCNAMEQNYLDKKLYKYQDKTVWSLKGTKQNK